MKTFIVDLLVELCTLTLLALFGGWAYSIICAIDDEETKRQALIDEVLR
jgi:hypothetical protein